MITSLTDTTTSEISKFVVEARRQTGTSTQGRVMTFIVVTDPNGCSAAQEAAELAAREHPSRVLLVVAHRDADTSGLDATVWLGEGNAQEVIRLDMRGEVAAHPTPVIWALLLPDSPVVAWWPTNPPQNPARDPIGRLATRRITDSSASPDPVTQLALRAATHQCGDSDLAWTRLTLWRALLAASLDQLPGPVRSVTVGADPQNSSALLLRAWLHSRLKAPMTSLDTDGPGITSVQIDTDDGASCITRDDARHGLYTIVGQPSRRVALPRRTIDELLSEELRRLDDDEVYGETLRVVEEGNLDA